MVRHSRLNDFFKILCTEQEKNMLIYQGGPCEHPFVWPCTSSACRRVIAGGSPSHFIADSPPSHYGNKDITIISCQCRVAHHHVIAE